MMKRKGFTFLLSLVGVALLLFLLTSLPDAAEKLKFGTGFKGSPYYELHALAAEEQGFWKQNGLETEWVNFRSGPAANQAMAANSLDLMQNSTVTALQGMGAGMPGIIVADSGRHEFLFWVRADSPMRGPKDLRGARIGVVRFGGLSHAFARAVAKALGLEKEVKFIAGGGGREELALLRVGKLDVLVSGYTTLAKAKYDGVIREFLSVEEYLPKGWLDQVLVSHKKFMTSQPETLRRAVKAYFLAGRFIKDNRDWTLAKLKSVYGFSEEEARDMYQAMHFSRDGRIDPKAVENVRNFLIEYGILTAEKIPPPKELYTDEFVR